MDSVATYLIRVENLYVIIHPNANGFDANIYYTVTNGLPALTVSTSANVVAENEVWDPKEIKLRNSFGGDSLYVTGKVYLNSEEVTTTGYNYTSRYRQDADFPQDIWGQDNQYLSGNSTYYIRKWRKWDGYQDNYISQTLSGPASKTARYAR